MKKRKLKFWVADSFDGSEIVICRRTPRTYERYSWAGPYQTLQEAKAAAIEYHRSTIQHARANIHKVRALKIREIDIYAGGE